jgi:uncharacterized protein (DUF169 family)
MNDELRTYHEFGEKIEEFLRPATFPLSIKLIKSESEIPPGSKRPSTDLKLQNFICQNFKMSRSYGWTIAVTEKDCNCRAARSVYGWDPITAESVEWSHKFVIGLYAKDLETSEKMGEQMYSLKNEFSGLVISPLTRTKVEPDVVLIHCLPAQAMRLVQGYLFNEGGVLTSSSAGRTGSCHEGVIKTHLTGLPQLVLLGNGDRIWGGAHDSEVMFSIPRSKLETVVRGLESTHQAGLRFPIPQYMNFSPGFQESFERRAKERAGGTIVKEG